MWIGSASEDPPVPVREGLPLLVRRTLQRLIPSGLVVASGDHRPPRLSREITARLSKMAYPQATHGVTCAWCDRVLKPGPEPVSHGICPECADAIEREAVDKPRGDDQDETSNPRWDPGDRDDSHERRELADELRADEARRH